MRPAFLIGSIAVCLLLACNNEKQPGVTQTSEEGTKTTVSAADMGDAADAVQQKIEELQKLAPYTLDQMKAMLPGELAGATRSSFSANSALGTAYAEAQYTLNDSTGWQLGIFDCAGEAGTGVYRMQYLSLMNVQSENDNEYSKTIDFRGSRAIEHLDKTNNNSSLTWLSGGRLLVVLEGKNTGVDLLKQAAGSLDLK